ncbi:unnamed protein product, partial [marine sediment metagenome]
ADFDFFDFVVIFLRDLRMGLPGFEPGSSGPKPESLTKLAHSPLKNKGYGNL